MVCASRCGWAAYGRPRELAERAVRGREPAHEPDIEGDVGRQIRRDEREIAALAAHHVVTLPTAEHLDKHSYLPSNPYHNDT
ncbi:hypothetical protein GCM10018954_075480 [Kutzneria kofuensis]